MMTLTTEQLRTLVNHIRANADAGIIAALAAGNQGAMREWYNDNSTFWVWRDDVPSGEVGNAIDLTNVGDLTTAESNRLQVSFMMVNSNGGAFHGNRPDHRGMFEDIFSGTAGSETRANLLPLWQRTCNNAESVFATGTGTECTALNSNGTPNTGSPGELVYVGSVTTRNIDDALELTA